MSYSDYKLSQKLELEIDDDNYYALIMTAMRKADDTNRAKLQKMWPEVWEELQARYWAPGGLLREEVEQMEDERGDQ